MEEGFQDVGQVARLISKSVVSGPYHYLIKLKLGQYHYLINIMIAHTIYSKTEMRFATTSGREKFLPAVFFFFSETFLHDLDKSTKSTNHTKCDFALKLLKFEPLS